MEIHKAMNHSEINVLQCNSCAITFPDSKAAARHFMDLHGLKYVGFCRHCGKCFRSSGGLSLHERMHSSSINNARCPMCPVCHKCFQTEIHLQRHMSVHDVGKPYVCTACGKSYKRKEALNYHLCKIDENQSTDFAN